jgi:hypothetical protein
MDFVTAALFTADFQVICVARHFFFLVGLETNELHIDSRRDSKIHIEVGCAELHAGLYTLGGRRAGEQKATEIGGHAGARDGAECFRRRVVTAHRNLHASK